MKILTVVGARPQFIKSAVVSHKLRKKHTEILVHTGQHYDYNMSELFFDELNIPRPNYNLGISGGSHADMTGQMMIAIEQILIKEKPDYLLVYGDTNSTLAGALAAAKLNIPICHIESGVRTHSMTNPEEINRICTDHISSKLMYCTPSAEAELQKEGLIEHSFFVGDPMYDAFIEYSGLLTPNKVILTMLNERLNDDHESIKVPLSGIIKNHDKFYYLTCHREENTRDDAALTEIFKAMNSFECPTVYPVHPRNKDRALRLKRQYGFERIILTEPVGYLESLALVSKADKIVTDSGGIQREAFFAGTKCVTILDFVCWPETMVNNRNTLSKPKAEEIADKMMLEQVVDPTYKPFGNGHSAVEIVKTMEI